MGYLEAFLGCLMSMIVYAQLQKTYQQLVLWLSRRRLKKMIDRSGIKAEDGHYFQGGICMVCKMPEAIYRMPGNEGRFVHPDPFKDW